MSSKQKNIGSVTDSTQYTILNWRLYPDTLMSPRNTAISATNRRSTSTPFS